MKSRQSNVPAIRRRESRADRGSMAGTGDRHGYPLRLWKILDLPRSQSLHVVPESASSATIRPSFTGRKIRREQLPRVAGWACDPLSPTTSLFS